MKPRWKVTCYFSDRAIEYRYEFYEDAVRYKQSCDYDIAVAPLGSRGMQSCTISRITE